jgi:tetratricopeptide (TPR) repeat protein
MKLLKSADPARYRPSGGAEYPSSPFGQALKQIAQLTKSDVGLEVAFADVGGWDTHVNQGAARGQLAGRLDDFARAVAALVAALGSTHGVERMVAASSLRSPGARPAVLRALDDPRRAVRIAALISLANTPGSLAPAERRAFARVAREFAGRARLHEDDAPIQADYGLVQLLAGDLGQAARALEISLGLDPDLAKASLLLGLARVEQGRLAEARSLLERVPPSDPGYRLAQDQLRALAGRR